MDTKTDKAQPKKRGRKPKQKKDTNDTKLKVDTKKNNDEEQLQVNEVSTDLLPIKKKRGRKPKPKQEENVKVPKKRGRKPKEIFNPKQQDVQS